jgi:hypothetical protein
VRYVDGAAGFVFISGLVLGIIQRQRTTAGQSAWTTHRWLVRRAALLYTVQALLVVSAIALEGPAAQSPCLAYNGWPGLLGRVLLMREQPTYVDILPMYVLFLLAAVPGIEGLRRGRSLFVIGASITLWAFTQSYPDALLIAAPLEHGYRFRWAAWQLLFLSGLCLGWHREELVASTPRLRRGALLAAAIIAVTALILAHAGKLGAHALDARLRLGESAGGLAAKATLGPLIIMDFAALFVLGVAAVAGLMRRSWALVPLGWLEAVGRKSLRCYVAITVMAILVSTMPHATWMAVRDGLVLVGAVLVHRVARIDVGARWSRQAISAPSAPA